MNRESNLSFPLNTIYTLKGGAIMLLLICGGGRVRLPGRGPQQHPSCPEVHAPTLGPGHLPLVIQVADPLLNLSGDSGLLLPDPIDVGVPSRSPKLNADAGSCCHSQRGPAFRCSGFRNWRCLCRADSQMGGRSIPFCHSRAP